MKDFDFSFPGRAVSFFASLQHFIHILASPLEYSLNQPNSIVSFIYAIEILYPSGELEFICMIFSEESETYILNVS